MPQVRPLLFNYSVYLVVNLLFTAFIVVRYFLIYLNFKSATKFSLQFFMLLFSSQFHQILTKPFGE